MILLKWNDICKASIQQYDTNYVWKTISRRRNIEEKFLESAIVCWNNVFDIPFSSQHNDEELTKKRITSL